MKKFYTLCIGLFAFVFLTNFVDEKAATRERIEISFDKHTNLADLVKTRERCEKFGIILRFTKIEFNSGGELSALSFDADCKDGFSGSGSSDDIIHLDQKFGFFRDYHKGVVVPFATGHFQ